jgi:hypothetical protein
MRRSMTPMYALCSRIQERNRNFLYFAIQAIAESRERLKRHRRRVVRIWVLIQRRPFIAVDTLVWFYPIPALPEPAFGQNRI